MIRFAWLQTRTQLLLVAAALAALAIVAAVTGIELAHLHHSLVTQCRGGCDLGVTRFLSHQQFLQRALGPLVDVVPALIGIFWGAPLLARELETGTYRLAWTQSVTRRRWLLTKLGVLGLAAAVVAGLLTLTITWWYRSLDAVDANEWSVFDRRDIVPIGYAVFAFGVGVLLGAVIRRVLPAMAGTLGVFVVVRIASHSGSGRTCCPPGTRPCRCSARAGSASKSARARPSPSSRVVAYPPAPGGSPASS